MGSCRRGSEDLARVGATPRQEREGMNGLVEAANTYYKWCCISLHAAHERNQRPSSRPGCAGLQHVACMRSWMFW